MKFLFAISFCVLIIVRLAIGDNEHVEKSISCYHCNSEYDPRCGDPFDPYTLGTVNCSIAPKPSKSVENITSTFCRKTIQHIYGETRIIRSCGYIPHEAYDDKCIRRSGTHDVRVHYCTCTGDLCNASASLSISQLIVLIATATGLLLNFYISA